jgi:hypothetical protein
MKQTESNQPSPQTAPILYEIRVEGCLPAQWADWFESLTITWEGGDTLLTGPLADQAALYGLLKKVRDLGMPLISVNRAASHQTEPNSSNKE